MRPDGHNEIDEALAARRLKRRIALVLPHWSAALEVIAGTDLALTVASRCTPKQMKNSHLRRFAPPIDLVPFAFQQAWHARRTDDAAHVWLRERIAQCVSST
jgi:DNA-binding transcriptional LysR family regulator